MICRIVFGVANGYIPLVHCITSRRQAHRHARNIIIAQNTKMSRNKIKIKIKTDYFDMTRSIHVMHWEICLEDFRNVQTMPVQNAIKIWSLDASRISHFSANNKR